MTTTSTVLLVAGAVALLFGAAVPGWDSRSASKLTVKRRIYWGGAVVGAVLLFLGGLPDLQSSVAFVGAAAILMVGFAYFRTPYIKLGGQVRSADPRYR
jgi:hypothetical protein